MNTMLLRIGLMLCSIGSVHSAIAQVVYYVNLQQELRYLELSTCKDTLITKVIFPNNPIAPASDVAIGPDGAFYVCYEGKSELYKLDPQTGQLTFLIKYNTSVRGLVCDKDGLLWAGGFSLYSYNTIMDNQLLMEILTLLLEKM